MKTSSYATELEDGCRKAEDKFLTGITGVLGDDEDEEEQRQGVLQVFREAINQLRMSCISSMDEAAAKFEMDAQALHKEAQESITAYRRLGAKVECERNEMIIEKEIFQTKVLEQQKQFEESLVEKLHQQGEVNKMSTQYISRLEACLQEINVRCFEILEDQNDPSIMQAESRNKQANDKKTSAKQDTNITKALEHLDSIRNRVRDMQAKEKNSNCDCSQLREDLSLKTSECKKLKNEVDRLEVHNRIMSHQLGELQNRRESSSHNIRR